MKFGETFKEYVHEDEGNKLSYVEYKSLKKVLKRCSACNTLKSSNECCSFCDQTFFPELKKEASDVAGCFSSRVRRLLRLHMAPGVQQYFISLRHCFVDDQQAMARECQMLMQYAVMNTTAMRKILKKYDKIHGSVKGRNFKSTISAEHLEILQSPWLIELGAFCLNFNASNGKSSRELFSSFPCDFDATEFTLTLTLPENIKLEYSLKCAVCLVSHLLHCKENRLISCRNSVPNSKLVTKLGFCFQPLCFRLWASFLQIMCMQGSFCDDMRWSKGCK